MIFFVILILLMICIPYFYMEDRFERLYFKIAMFQGIAFEKYLKNIRIEILEVYKGTQYDDTCISGIMINNFYPLKE